MDLNLTDSDNPRDHLLALNDLGLPKVVDMSKIEPGVMNTAITCIARLIVMRKGTDMDRPEMGIDIVGRYRFSESSELRKLQNEIEEQIAMYLPEFLPVDVEASMVTEESMNQLIKKIKIAIFLDGVMYQLLYNSNESKLEVLQY
jgi:hypothetical protein